MVDLFLQDLCTRLLKLGFRTQDWTELLAADFQLRGTGTDFFPNLVLQDLCTELLNLAFRTQDWIDHLVDDHPLEVNGAPCLTLRTSCLHTG